MTRPVSLDKLLKRMGGSYIILALVAAQLIAVAGAIPGMLSIQINTVFLEEELNNLAGLTGILAILASLILTLLGARSTRTARKRLDEWSNNRLKQDPKAELEAWREITSLTWQQSIAAMLTVFFVVILPIFVITYIQTGGINSQFQPTSPSATDPIFVLIGSLIAMLGSVILFVFLIERLTQPARLALLPKDFDTQLSGRAGQLLIGKLSLLILGLITISVLLIAPLGFQQIIRYMYADTSPLEAYTSMQAQSILFAVLAFVLGVGFTQLVSRAITDPINELIATFNKIEGGDLSQRARVNATDELGVVTIQFNRMLTRLESLQTTLEQQVQERTKQLRASNDVARVAASSLDPDELLTRVVDLFPEQFGYYYAAVYLLDSGEKWAELKHATGEAGRVLKQNHHRLEVAGKSMVGWSIRERSVRITQSTSEEKQRFDNPLLPYTRSEIVVPLVVGNRVIGALDVQSTREADFGPDVIETMRNMASQVTVALENARLFQEAQMVIKEMQAVQQQYLLEGWRAFTAEHQEMEYAVGDESIENDRSVDFPISLREQVLGQITLEGKEDWSLEQKSLVDAIAKQAAVALENARLVSESRQVAARERMLAEINSRVWSSATIDGVLQTVIKELGRRLDAAQATIELDIDEQ
jgi:GAF domain-containing protein